MKRLALMLLALFMVPVVIVATPAVANAATKYSGTVATGFRHDSWVPGEWVDCTFTAFYAVTGSEEDGYSQSVKTKNGDCSTGANFNLEGAAVTLQYNGMTGTGVECAGSATFALGTNEVMPNSSASMTTFPGPAAALCEVQELCWSFSKSQTWGNDHSGSGCEPLTMGTAQLPSDAVSACAAFAAGSIQIVGSQYQEGAMPAPATQWGIRVNLSRAPTAGGIMAIYYGATAGTIRGSFNSDPQYTSDGHTATSYAAGASQVFFDVRTRSYKPTWVTVITASNFNIGNYNWPAPYNTMTDTWGPTGRIGYNDPDKCVWYFGAKMFEAAGDTDVPAGTPDGGSEPAEPEPVNTAPTGKPESCTFSLTDPATWLEGGMCAAVGLLGAIWNTLGDVVAAVLGIPAAILDGLSGLFVPDDGYLNAKTSQLKTSWNNTQPGAWTGAVTDQAWDLPAGGCSGVPLNFDLPGGVQVDEHLGEACTGTMATVAATTKLAASAILVIFGALACLRALGSGFGWNPSIGRGESA